LHAAFESNSRPPANVRGCGCKTRLSQPPHTRDNSEKRGNQGSKEILRRLPRACVSGRILESRLQSRHASSPQGQRKSKRVSNCHFEQPPPAMCVYVVAYGVVWERLQPRRMYRRADKWHNSKKMSKRICPAGWGRARVEVTHFRGARWGLGRGSFISLCIWGAPVGRKAGLGH